jgi:hypothetical protein
MTTCKIYTCEICKYNTPLRANYTKHLNTDNHIRINNICEEYEGKVKMLNDEIDKLKNEVTELKSVPEPLPKPKLERQTNVVDVVDTDDEEFEIEFKPKIIPPKKIKRKKLFKQNK